MKTQVWCLVRYEDSYLSPTSRYQSLTKVLDQGSFQATTDIKCLQNDAMLGLGGYTRRGGRQQTGHVLQSWQKTCCHHWRTTACRKVDTPMASSTMSMSFVLRIDYTRSNSVPVIVDLNTLGVLSCLEGLYIVNPSFIMFQPFISRHWIFNKACLCFYTAHTFKQSIRQWLQGFYAKL